MSISTWLSGTFTHKQARRTSVVTRRQRRPRRHTFRPGLEGLEIRLTLSLTTLASFGGSNGDGPIAGLIMDTSGNLYGTTSGGGASGDGTVFELAKGSSTLTTLASFNGSNGQNPFAGLIMDSSGNLYGTTAYQGAHGDGTVFEFAKGSSTITTLASFLTKEGGGDGAVPGRADHGQQR